MSVLVVKDMDKIYFGGYTGVKGVNLSLESGERLAVFGKKGSGKSTLLKLIATLESPTAGSITIDGRDVSELKTRELNISYATSELPLFRLKSVYDNLAYPLKIRHEDKAKIDTRVHDVANIFGLENILDERVRYLDESVAGRVLIARAFMREADFYLFDNVLEHLTIEDRDEVMSIFSMLMPRIRGAIIYATDRLDEVSLISGDRVIMLSNGAMIESGSLSSIYADPRTLDGIRLLTRNGVNELVRRVDKDATGYFVELLGRRPVDVNDVYLDKDIIVAIRPDDIRYDSMASGPYVVEVVDVYRGIRHDMSIVKVGEEELMLETLPLEVNVGDRISIEIHDVLLYDIRAERRLIVD